MRHRLRHRESTPGELECAGGEPPGPRTLHRFDHCFGSIQLQAALIQRGPFAVQLVPIGIECLAGFGERLAGRRRLRQHRLPFLIELIDQGAVPIFLVGLEVGQLGFGYHPRRALDL